MGNMDNRINGYVYMNYEKTGTLYHLDFDPDYHICGYLETFEDSFFGLSSIMGSFSRKEDAQGKSEKNYLLG